MKIVITTLQQSNFKEAGKISFADIPLDLLRFQDEIEKEKKRVRDLWRHSSFLKKVLLQTIAPILIDLLDEGGVRLLADHYFEESPKKTTPLEKFFGFQGILGAVSLGETITFYHPSMPLHEKECYVALFGSISSSYIKKVTDPFNANPQKLGYSFGDVLKNEFYPLVFK